ncbi:hypothetical protein [Salinicola halophilus]|uniref:hypothetical protein n=1 Tax=Salinicola halophilus TaxID=184065 RepID=UPI000DA1C8CA|nr:hypothetical protein [Salinicola halophilus]
MKGITRAALTLAIVAAITGCQSLPDLNPPRGCGEIPRFADNVCLLDSWVAFGLESQRGDTMWRRTHLRALEGDQPERKAARAVVLAEGGPAQWAQASELYKASIESAPPRLQPLLRQWLNALEARRRLQRQTPSAPPATATANDDRAQALARENQQLKDELQAVSDKLEALTDIERTINARE